MSSEQPEAVCIEECETAPVLPEVKILKGQQGLNAKTFYSGDIGYDIICSRSTPIPPRQTVAIPSEARVQLPQGVFAFVMGRSSLNKKGLICNVGLIDSSYTGTLGPFLYNSTDLLYLASPGDRVAQLVIFNQQPVQFTEVEAFDETDRADKGHGSTGK